MKISYVWMWAGLFLGFSVIGVQGAWALPVGSEREAQALSKAEAEFSPLANVDFTAIIRLSNCSGSLVRFVSSLPTDPAMVLTNGHCVGFGSFIPPGEVIVNQPVSRTFWLLNAQGLDLTRLNGKRVLFATMTQTDMALYEVQETYEDIEKRFGVRALTLSDRHPEAARSIAIPSGYWKKIYACSIDRFIFKLKEDDWTWIDSIRYTRPGCDVIGGTSGSPIVDSETYEVIGVNNTGNESGYECSMNNPCEIDEQGNISVIHQASYGQQTYWIYDCLDSSNQVNLDNPACRF